jgi:hypothetical protein
MSAVVGDGVEFVELVLAETLGAEAGDAKTETGDDQNDKCGEDKCFAVCQDTASGEELRPQTGSDDGFSVYRQDLFPLTKCTRVSEAACAVKNSFIHRLHRTN